MRRYAGQMAMAMTIAQTTATIYERAIHRPRASNRVANKPRSTRRARTVGDGSCSSERAASGIKGGGWGLRSKRLSRSRPSAFVRLGESNRHGGVHLV